MFGNSMTPIYGAGVLLAALMASSLEAQTTRQKSKTRRTGDVKQMEIYSGTTRAVRYFGTGLSPSESSTLREMERLENEAEYTRDLLALKKQYAADERLLQPYRTLVQNQLYGVDVTRTAYGSNTLTYGYGGGYAGAYAGYYGYPYSYSGAASATAMAGDSVTQTRSLATGMGPEGKVKEAMAVTLAQQATPEYAASIDRAYDRVALRASVSPTLRAALKLPTTEDARKTRQDIIAAEGTDTATAQTSPITITLKGGEKIQAKKLQEAKDWYVIDRADGTTTRIRQSEVTRIDVTSTGIKYATFEN